MSREVRRFKRYPAYKDSGVEWIGEIPEDWHVRPLKRLAKFIGGGTPAKVRKELGSDPLTNVLTKDSRLRFRPLEKEALLAARVREFVFTGGNVPGAAMADAIVKAIPKVQALLAAKRRAFVARITASSDVAILLEA